MVIRFRLLYSYSATRPDSRSVSFACFHYFRNLTSYNRAILVISHLTLGMSSIFHSFFGLCDASTGLNQRQPHYDSTIGSQRFMQSNVQYGCSVGHLTCCESGIPATAVNMATVITGCQAAIYPDAATTNKGTCGRNLFATCCSVFVVSTVTPLSVYHIKLTLFLQPGMKDIKAMCTLGNQPVVISCSA